MIRKGDVNTEPGEYVQPIMLLVDKADPAAEVDAIRATAVAAVSLYAQDLAAGQPPTEWDAWLSGPFAKTVRRADRNTFAKVLDTFDPHDYSLDQVGTAQAAAFRPVPNTELLKTLKRLQVSGTQLPDTPGWKEPAGQPTVILNRSLGMSTGKAAAQAAHALFLWYLQQPAGSIHIIDCGIRFADTDQFKFQLVESGATAVITDAGRTEIASGSVTAFAHGS